MCTNEARFSEYVHMRLCIQCASFELTCRKFVNMRLGVHNSITLGYKQRVCTHEARCKECTLMRLGLQRVYICSQAYRMFTNDHMCTEKTSCVEFLQMRLALKVYTGTFLFILSDYNYVLPSPLTPILREQDANQTGNCSLT